MHGGAIKSILYLGAIKAFTEAGIDFDLIGGLSGGSIVASGYALHKDIDKLIDLLSQFQVLHLLDLNPRDGYSVVDTDKLEHLLDKCLDSKTFADLQIPCIIFATDLETGQSVVLDKGPLAKAVTASCSLPPLLHAYKGYPGKEYVDGGFSAYYKASYFRQRGANIVIGMDCSRYKSHSHNLMNDAFNAINTSIVNIEHFEAQHDPVDYSFVLESDILGVNPFSLDKHRDELVEQGYTQTLQHIPRIQEIIKSK